MATKGKEAKNYITNILKEVFKEDFIGEKGGKVYVRAPEDGTKIQVAISFSCPSTNVFSDTLDGGAFSLTEQNNIKEQKVVENPVIVTEQETENIRKLLAELGL